MALVDYCEDNDCMKLQSKNSSCPMCPKAESKHCKHHCAFHKNNADICGQCHSESGHKPVWICKNCSPEPEVKINHCLHNCPKWRQYDLCQPCRQMNKENWLCKRCKKKDKLEKYHCDHKCNLFKKVERVCMSCKANQNKRRLPSGVIEERWQCIFCTYSESNYEHCPHKCPVIAPKFGCMSRFFMVMGLIFWVLDLWSDIWLAIGYVRRDDYIKGGLTASFILVSGVCMSIYSMYFWVKMKQITTFYVVSAILLVTPISWTKILLNKSRMWSRHAKTKQDMEVFVKNYVHFLKTFSKGQLIEGFLESAPQMLLQLYIVFETYNAGEGHFTLGTQIFCILSSWISISWIMVTIYSTIHYDRFISFKMKMVLFGWQLFTIGPRVVAMALFASVYHDKFFLFCTIHILIMFVYNMYFAYKWQARCENEDQSEGIFTRGFMFWIKLGLGTVLISATNVFCYNPKMTFMADENGDKIISTCQQYVFYYILVFVENIILTLMWLKDAPKTYNSVVALVIVFGGFLMGLVFMRLYYVSYHQKRVIDPGDGFLWHGHRAMYNKHPHIWEWSGWLLGRTIWKTCKQHEHSEEIYVAGMGVDGCSIHNPIHQKYQH